MQWPTASEISITRRLHTRRPIVGLPPPPLNRRSRGVTIWVGARGPLCQEFCSICVAARPLRGPPWSLGQPPPARVPEVLAEDGADHAEVRHDRDAQVAGAELCEARAGAT